MQAYAIHVLKRLGQFILVVYIGITITFFITHLTPVDPVEHAVAQVSSFGFSSPESIELLRTSLREMYGVGDDLGLQYLNFLKRVAVLDFGPSLSAFPTPVGVLIGRALPWTIGLLAISTLLSWFLGNLLGGLAGYYRKNRLLKAIGVIAMGMHPVPYYIVAFVLLIVFTFLLPILPSGGGYEMNLTPGFTPRFIGSVFMHSILPALSLILVGIGGWFMGMRALVSNIVTDDYVVYAELAGVPRGRILTSYVMRNAFMPQITGLAISIGSIFNGAIITEQVFGYPGIGRLLVDAVHAADYSLVLGIASISIISVSAAVFLIDIIYPLIDPRVQVKA
ncbi:ABC transporter permease [Mesorhizobium sp. BR1-1-9]|uniref:ABC transporter permease n=1 Tax=unclassified Mesorhizobium TaxID=325217 RepID=UPI001129EB89|nr:MULTISPECIES: ABC transporter permease [unclassified Mesorhizobium]MBZ9811642.1 ABC transporter permease [Mesorhizobium sp. ESP-6-2]MBZ9871341.1 ABC transporter permease [Mesorhizobium sp. BR1-1-9]MBZ9943225.1 ABC transporter permease [Mesorhizobium sp. BR1-1-13]TPM26205.1 ABC transporter permease [Mesorhizobium sp. B2-2-2]